MKYIFIDIDGTLFSHRLKEVPESATKALAKLKENGHKVFICTGRSLSSCRDFYGLDVDGFVFSAGAVVYVDKKRIYSHSFTAEQEQEVSNLVNKLNLGLMLEGDAGCYQNDTAKENNREFFEKENKVIDVEQAMNEYRVFPIEYRDERDPIYKICVYGKDQNTFDQFTKELSDTYHTVFMNGEVDTLRIGVELTLVGINKSTAAQLVCEHYGATMADSVAIGDSMNDFEVVRDANVGIAMGNAHPDLKAIADYVTDDVAEDGLYNAFKHFG
ncbi:MAG: HAD family hydrolase, partial [Anaerorhabdus sp.]